MQTRFFPSFMVLLVALALVLTPLAPTFAEETASNTTSDTSSTSTQETTASETTSSSTAATNTETNTNETQAASTETSSTETTSTEGQTESSSSETASETTAAEETAAYESASEEIQGDETASSEEQSTESDETSSFNKLGQVVEIEGTEVPTSIIIKEVIFGKAEVSFGDQYTINITSSTKLDFQMNWWMAGDLARVSGTMNSATGIVEAATLNHLSHAGKFNMGHNGWVEEINLDGNYLQVQWYGKLAKINIIEETRIILPGKGDITINDLQLHDRVRMRGAKVGESEVNAKTIIVLRRGETKFIKLRTKQFLANYVGMVDENTFTIEGRRKTFTVNITEDTKIIKNDEEQSDLSGFSEGDRLFLSARLNDDGTLDAKVVRNFVGLNEGGSIVGVVGKLDTNNKVMNLRLSVKKLFRVDLTDSTTIVDESGNTVSIDNLAVGNRVRVEGTMHEKLPLISATKITVIDTNKTIKKVKRTAFAR